MVELWEACTLDLRDVLWGGQGREQGRGGEKGKSEVDAGSDSDSGCAVDDVHCSSSSSPSMCFASFITSTNFSVMFAL